MKPKVKKLNPTTVDIAIAGTTHRNEDDIKKIHRALKNQKSHNVKFKYQTDNKTDKNAIMVFVNNIHIGYIPKDYCTTFKQTMFKWKIIKRTAYMICGCSKGINDAYHIVITVAKRD